MVTGDVIAGGFGNVSAEVVQEVGKIGLWLQAIGVIVILWLVFNAVNLWLNRKRWKKLEEFEATAERIERKLDKVLKKS